MSLAWVSASPLARAPGELVQAVAEALGPVDVLVSNAGLSRVQPLEDITAAQFDEMLAAAILANAYLTSQVISLDGGIQPR